MRDRLLRWIRADFPALHIHSAELAEGGWDNDVIVINDELVFRFPRDDAIRLDVEVAVLNHLRGKTTLRIPVVEFVGRTGRYIGYRKIPGSALTRDDCGRLTPDARRVLADDLAEFLFELHEAIPVDLAAQLGVVTDDPTIYLREARTLHGRLEDAATADFIQVTLAEAERFFAVDAPRSFLYNDLHGDNMAFDTATGRLNGIFDFGDIAIGDLHREFSPLYRLSHALLEETVASYERLTRARLSLRRMVVLQRLDRLSDLAETIDQPGNPEPAKVLREIRDWAAELHIYSNTGDSI